MTIQKQAQKYYEMFETKERGDETITVFKSNRSQALFDSVFEAHGDRLPSDWIFDKYREILGAISDYNIDTPEELDDNRSEIVDGLVDVYTSDLTGWLHDDNRNVYYLEEAQKEFGAAEDGFQSLAQAQYMAIDEIFQEVANLLTA